MEKEVTPPPNGIKKWWRYLLGGFLVFLGLLGFLIPIFPGFIFILTGLYFLNSPLLKKIKEHLKGKKEDGTTKKE